MGREQISLAICGGGIGGLCLAASLLSRENASREKGEEKLKIHVYEAAAAFSEIGAGVGFGPNALRAMRLLDGGMEAKGGIWEGYKRCETTTFGSEAERKRFFNFRYGMAVPSKSDHDGEVRGDSRGAKIDGVEQWEEGELIADVRSDTETSSIHRARFLAELVALLPPGCTSVKKRLVGIDEEPVSESLSSSSEKGGSSSGREGGVILHFADGTSARHDAVIGCDGVKSVVRKILLGERDRACEPVFSGKYCYRGLVEAGKLVEVLGEERALDSQMYLGYRGHVLTTAIEQGKTVNVVATHTKADGIWPSSTWVKPSTKQEMLADFKDFSPPVLQILSLMEKTDIWALFDHPPAHTYHRGGKICLLGDSAHASTPHHGAGAGMAIEDALVLSSLLRQISGGRQKGELERVFDVYDLVRRPRSQRLVGSSRRMGRVYDFEDESVGGDKRALRDYLAHAWEWIWGEDVEGMVERAVGLLRGRSDVD